MKKVHFHTMWLEVIHHVRCEGAKVVSFNVMCLFTGTMVVVRIIMKR